jgi:Cu/Ag efflux protein CusF
MLSLTLRAENSIMKKTILALSVLAMAALQSCKHGEPVNLKFNFQPGSKYQYVTETQQAIKQVSQNMTMNQSMTMSSTYEVSAADGSNKKITVMYDRLAIKTASPAMNVEYDSQDPARQNENLKYMSSLLNKPFSMTVNEKGEILQLNGMKEMIDGIIDSTNPNMAGIKEQMNQTFNDTAIRSMMQQSFNIYPDKAITPGESWEKKFTLTSIINMEMDNKYKLVSVNNGVAHLEVNSKITGKPGNNPAMAQMKIEMNGTQTGTMDVEVSSGLITDSKLKQSMKGKMSVMGMEIPMEISSDIHIAGKKL